MALFVTDQGKRSELQERLAAELREKMARQSEIEDKPDLPDGIDDSVYVRDFDKKPGLNGRLLALVVVLAVILVGCGLAIVLSQR